jgi:hypothetical protein
LYAQLAGEWKGEQIPGISEWIMARAKIPVAEYEELAEACEKHDIRLGFYYSQALAGRFFNTRTACTAHRT